MVESAGAHLAGGSWTVERATFVPFSADTFEGGARRARRSKVVRKRTGVGRMTLRTLEKS